MSKNYKFQPRQPLNTRSPLTSSNNTPITSATNSPRQSSNHIPGNATPDPISRYDPAVALSAKKALKLDLQKAKPVRSPHSPLYVPAVLRQTERPARLSRNPSQASLKNSASAEAGDVNGRGEQAASGSGSFSGTDEEGDPYELLENEKITISKEAEEWWMREKRLGEVTGSPTREHWRADAASPNCDFPGCRTSFGLFMRRHHCRHCGHVFCATHTPHIVPLDQWARFHPYGESSRACEMCFLTYRKWDRKRISKLIEIERDFEEQRRIIEQEADSGGGGGATMGRPMLRPGMGRKASEDSDDPLSAGGIGWPQHQVGSLVTGSVPRDWSWSTF